MSLNLVSEQLLAANGLKHQTCSRSSVNWPNVALIMAISIFSRAITNPGLEDRIIKDGSYNIDQALVCVQSVVKNRICLC